VLQLAAGDRFEEIRRLLDATVSEFQSLFQSASGFEETRIGNGWAPEKIEPELYYVNPKPIDEVCRIAEGRKRSLFRGGLFSFIGPRDAEVGLIQSSVLLIPFWRIKGFHECFYFRGNSYKIPLPEDVIAVEIEGKVRDLLGEGGELRKLGSLKKKLLGIRDSGKSIRLEATELAYLYNDGVIFVDANGKEDLETEAFFESNLPMQNTSNKELKDVFPNATVAKEVVSKENLVRSLHSRIVKPPAAFTRILSNRFQVTELVKFLMPIYVFEFAWKGQSRQIMIHGFTGAVLS
jgi:hypothetical protein